MAAPKGNKNPTKGKRWAGALRRALYEREALKPIAIKVVELALEGDRWAIGEIGDRLDGKAAQSTELTVNDRRSVPELTEDELDRRIAAALAGKASEDQGAQVPAPVRGVLNS